MTGDIGDVWEDRVLRAMDMVMAGRYLAVPAGTCPVTTKLRALSDQLEDAAKRALADTVTMSGNVNTAVIDAAEMMAEIAEVDRRAQAVSQAASQLFGSVTGIADAAGAAAHEAAGALDGAEEGRALAGRAVTSMQAIADAVAAAAAKVDDLAEASSEIAEVVSKIQGVAKRTNLLALNASVEAARAGEWGRGFRVVADEVAGLASQSGAATVDIRKRMKTLRAEMGAIVEAMHEGAEAVAQGQRVIGQTGEDMTRAVALLQDVSTRMAEVSSILGQQTAACDEVSGETGAVARMAAHDVSSITGVIEAMHDAARTVARSLAGFAKLEIEDLDLHLAKSDHMVWRSRLADVLLGRLGLRPDELSDARACRFGRWYFSVTDGDLRAHPDYLAVEDVNDRVHALGTEVVRCQEGGNLVGALTALKQLEAASRELIGHMDALLARPRPARPEPWADSSAAAVPADLARALEQRLDLVLAGRYRSVEGGDHSLLQRVLEMARLLEERASAELKRNVDMSMNVNAAVTETAGMMRDITEVDRRSQSIAAAAEELVASVGEITRNCASAAEDARAAQQAAWGGQQATSRAVATMEDIAQAVADAAAKVDDLAEASRQIGNIVDQIEALAQQTNLLALNATIEATRAGEAGKGFAVVAGEVKTLANQTAKATGGIQLRIETLRDEMAGIVARMSEGAQAVEQGRAVIAATGEGMARVAAQVAGVTARMEDISALLAQQTAASSDVSRGIGVIAQMAGRNVAAIGQVVEAMDRSAQVISATLTEMTRFEIKDVTLHVAKSDHVIWRKRLADMLVGREQLAADSLADHTQCRLGKWCSGVQDPDIRSHPAFAQLEEPHRQVHAHGIEAARRHGRGDLDGALEEVAKVAEASKAVVDCLDRLAAR